MNGMSRQPCGIDTTFAIWLRWMPGRPQPRTELMMTLHRGMAYPGLSVPHTQ